MDLGIAGTWALVCAASKGLGRGCAQALARERRATCRSPRAAPRTLRRDGATRSARATGRQGARASRATSRRREGRAAALAACPQPDILVNNAGGPPPGDFRDWDRDGVDQARSTPTC